MSNGGPLFKLGDRVRQRSKPERGGVIVGAGRKMAGKYWYRVDSGVGRPQDIGETDLELRAEEGDDIQSLLISNRFGSRDAFSKIVTHLKLTESLRSEIYSLHASRTTFYPHQFKPVLKFIDSERNRLLIADEVGLGKTIEAGLVMTEQRQRAPFKRVLIVPPSHLVTKWRDEMCRRFALEFEMLDTAAMLKFLSKYEEEQEESALLGILSLQAFRGRRLQDRWEEVAPAFDLVIFDEAGRLRNTGTLSNSSAARVCEGADGVLLLTATPVQTDNANLFNLLRLLDPVEFDSIELFAQRLVANEFILNAQRLLARGQLTAAHDALRGVESTSLARRFLGKLSYSDVLTRLETVSPDDRRGLVELQRDLIGLNVLGNVYSRSRKRDVEANRVIRQARAYRVDPSQDESEFYQQVTDLCRENYKRRGGDLAAVFQSVMMQRQVASSMVALVDDWLDARRTVSEADVNEMSDVAPEDLGIELDALTIEHPDLTDLGDLRGWQRRLQANDTKFKALCEALSFLWEGRPAQKVVVFAFFKRTLRYLERRLSEMGIASVRIDGDVPSNPFDPDRDERGKRIERFRDEPDIRVLLSSEVGDEGIDLQFASTLINYDLPWNPMRVEQRIGRIDRLGQPAERITIVNLSLKGTIEDRILDRLYNRIGIFERSIGDLEEILGDEIDQLQKALFSPDLTEQERIARLEQTALAIEQRQLAMEQLERETDRLLGNEQFLRDEIEKAHRQRRYVGGEELLIYLRDFLKVHYPTSVVEDVETGRIYRLRVPEPLRQLVIRAVPADDLGRKQFLVGSQSGEILFTTDQGVAEANRKIEFLTFHHPLVRAVKAYYEAHSGEIHPASFVTLKTDLLDRGRYLWFLYDTAISGVHDERELILVVFPENGLTPLPQERSEELLAELIAGAEAVPSGRRQIAVTPDVCGAADEIAATRLEQRRHEKQRRNDALVENRLASLRESYERNCRIQERRMETARQRKRQETYLRSIEGRLRRLTSVYEERRQRIEATRALGISLDLRAAGGVEIAQIRASTV